MYSLQVTDTLPRTSYLPTGSNMTSFPDLNICDY